MAGRHLYIETEGAYNFRIEISEHDTRPAGAIVTEWLRQVQRDGLYYHEEDKAGFPWHSILQVSIRENKK
jgi:hypothetical protein